MKRQVIFRIPSQHFQTNSQGLVFRHDYKGRDMFWIVPFFYVIQFAFKDDMWSVRISEAYFAISTNQLAA